MAEAGAVARQADVCIVAGMRLRLPARVVALVVAGPCAAAGCASPPPATTPVRITIGVAVPLSGPDQAAGESLVRGVRLAAGDAFAVTVADDGTAGAAESLSLAPEVMGVVAHVGRAAAARQAADWLRLQVPAVITAPGAAEGLPRVIPPPGQLAACAARLFGEGPYVLRTDGSPDGVAAAAELSHALGERSRGQSPVAAADAANEAAKLASSADEVVFVGDPRLGGNLLRALRAFSPVPFRAIAAEDPAFLSAAGSAAEGARVTGVTRPARGTAFRAAFEQRFGAAPDGQAVDGYDAARLLIAAWSAAHARDANVTRSAVAAALPGVEGTGSGGPMHLDETGLLQPVACQQYVVRGGVFVPELSASLGDDVVLDAVSAPVPPVVRKKRRAEGEWLGLPREPTTGDPAPTDERSAPIRTPGSQAPLNMNHAAPHMHAPAPR